MVVELTATCFGMLSFVTRKERNTDCPNATQPIEFMPFYMERLKDSTSTCPFLLCLQEQQRRITLEWLHGGSVVFFSEIILYFWCVILEPGLLCQMKRLLMHTGSWKQSFTCFFLQYRFLCIHVFNHPLIMFYHVQVPMNAVCMLSDLPWITVPEQTISSADLDCKNIGTS